ncbi:MAG: polysaccharide deacetylase family protein [Deltaproteobacteria bacterium]|nr:polysaccharide deacetylase family protein [Deltaproteobacteria bacterium]
MARPGRRRWRVGMHDLSKLERLLPDAVLLAFFRWAVGTSHVALCLHRVCQSPARPAWMSMPVQELDRLLELAVAARPMTKDRWLTVCFDDGYADAAEYVAQRAPGFPGVEWLVFICPEKIEKRTGFRWDLLDEYGRPPSDAKLFAPFDLERENDRDDLRDVATQPEFRIVTLAQCRLLQAIPNVLLGNHTNVHPKLVLLTPEQASREFLRSAQAFERLFGKQEHFAIPFGTPEEDFDESHVALLRALTRARIWSTEPRPFRPSERVLGATLPRFALDGRWSARQHLLFIALSALRCRLTEAASARLPAPPEATASATARAPRPRVSAEGRPWLRAPGPSRRRRPAAADRAAR